MYISCPLDHIDDLELFVTRLQESLDGDANAQPLVASLLESDRELIATLYEQARVAAEDRALNPQEDE
jgi:hypothetical protein